ncbi:MAG: chemotaxis protein [Rhodospirillaceae bacterium]
MTPSGETPIQHAGTRRYRGILRQVEVRIRALFPEINRANRAMFRLADLSEDMRILSLNAELAAGRAGQKGAAVRALTQYTRGLVRRLVDINTNASGLRNLYDAITDALRTLRHLRQLEEATVRVDIADMTAKGLRALGELELVRSAQLHEMAARIAGINEGATRLGVVVRVVDDVVSQAASIATNIAAEAVTAGSHEAEFKAVSETMTRYVEELRIMNDQAARGVRGALEGCKALVDAAATLTRHQPGAGLQLEAGGARV